MITATLQTWDGQLRSGEPFDKEFESTEKLHEWLQSQSGHPFLHLTVVECQKVRQATVGLEADGWGVIIDGKSYRWNHNDDDMGTDGIREILEDLGFDVTFEEWY